MHTCSFNFSNTSFRSGEAWRQQRSALGKLIMPSNVYGYTPGFNKITAHLISNLLASKNDDGYVQDIVPHLIIWGAQSEKTINENLVLNKFHDFCNSLNFQSIILCIFSTER